MPLLLIAIQNLPNLPVQMLIAPGQPLGQVFMNGGFGDAKVLGGRAYRGTRFNHVHSQCAGSFFDGI
jgi:hypothetical protein